ncbi:MAG: tetratricopeptide repeat protein [Anaerolineales bacterium]
MINHPVGYKHPVGYEPCQSIPIENDQLEPFEDRIDILFHELELATKWQRPSVLLAVYSSEYVRADADIALENRLHGLGQSTYHIKIKSPENADISLLISELANLSNVVFFVEGLRWGADEANCYAYRTLNKSREFFIENQIRVVFWLTENEAIDLAHYAPDYWSFRHRVIEFVDSPKPEQISPQVLESAWQDIGEFSDTSEDLDAKIALRTALLTDLPAGNESTFARANLLLTLGMLHWRRGDYERASQFLNTALDMAARLEDNRFEALCFNAIALVETNLGRVEEAIQAYQNAISLAPEHISAWNNLGNLYIKLERHAEALTAFQKAIEQNASDGVGWDGLGDLYHKLGRNDDAIYAFLKAIEFSPNYAHSWNGLGNSYMQDGRLDEALAAHQKAIEIDRRTVNSWLGLGDIYRLQGKNEDACIAYQTTLELDPQNARAWNQLGNIHYDLDAYEEAMPAYEKAIELKQADSLSYGNLASIYVHKGCYKEAVPLLQNGIELSNDKKDTACLWNRLGDAYRRLGDYDNAIAAYRQADILDLEAVSPQSEPVITGSEPQVTSSAEIPTQPALNPEIKSLQPEPLQPESAGDVHACPSEKEQVTDGGIKPVVTKPEAGNKDWLDGLASVLPVRAQPGMVESTQSDQVETGHVDAINMVPEIQSAYPVTARESEPILPDITAYPGTEDPTGQSGKAVAGSGGQSDPVIDAENAHIWNELGNIYSNTGAIDEAVHAFEKAIELDRSYAWSYNNLASLYFHQGRYADAIPLYQQGLQFLGEAKDKALLWNRLGDSYRRLDEHDKAAAAYRKAMELDPDNVSLLTRARFSLLGNCRA